MASDDSYWKFVEPIWDSVDIDGSEEDFLTGFQKATVKQSPLLAGHWAQSEIMNGGLGQIFSNPTGILAPEAVEAFRVLGMPKCASILSEVMMFFGELYPRDRSARQRVLELFWEAHGEDAIPPMTSAHAGNLLTDRDLSL